MSGIRIQTNNDDIHFGVMTVPNRKSKALYCTRGANYKVLAYFTTDENAEKFQKIIDRTIEILSKK
jgi:YHS domain-containing protein